MKRKLKKLMSWGQGFIPFLPLAFLQEVYHA
jgi:hypothetical protein